MRVKAAPHWTPWGQRAAAATASSTGMEPTMSEAWLTVVRGQALELKQKLNGNAEGCGDEQHAHFRRR